MNKVSATKHDYKDLFSHYSDLITQMENEFTSHKFILNLAHQQQRLYIEALYFYSCKLYPSYGKKPAPFLYVHKDISRQLNKYQHLIQKIGRTPDSKDIFGHSESCMVWRKR